MKRFLLDIWCFFRGHREIKVLEHYTDGNRSWEWYDWCNTCGTVSGNVVFILMGALLEIDERSDKGHK